MTRIALVMGAGGVVGHAYHAGTVAALAEGTGWDPRRADVLVGTSAGSVVAAMLRAGASPADLYARAVGQPLSREGMRLFSGMQWPNPSAPIAPQARGPLGDPARLLVQAALQPWKARPGAFAAAALPPGRLPTTHISAGIRHLYRSQQGAWPSEPLWICAVRVEDGARVVWGRDPDAPDVDVGTAVAASCAIPGYYQPVMIHDKPYVDGGVYSLTNADVLWRRPLDLVLISSPMTSRGTRPRMGLDAQARALFSLQLAREVRGLRRRGIPVVTFQPVAADLEAMGTNAMDARRREAVASRARESALRSLEHPQVRDRLALLRQSA